MMTISSPEDKARMDITYNGCITYPDRAMTVGNGWGVAPMNWPDCYRVVVDGRPTGDPIFAPEGYWAVMDALATDLGIRE